MRTTGNSVGELPRTWRVPGRAGTGQILLELGVCFMTGGLRTTINDQSSPAPVRRELLVIRELHPHQLIPQHCDLVVVGSWMVG